MVIYPYSLEHLVNTEAVFDEATASWVGGSEDWVKVGRCRDDVNTGGKITTADGETYVFGSAVYLPKGDYSIKYGDKVRVFDGETERVSGEVKKIYKGRLNFTIWL